MAENEQAITARPAGAAAAAVALVPEPLNPYIEGIGRLPIPRQIGVIVGLAASIAAALWLVLWSQQADMRPLYGSLENLDAPSIVRILEENRIPYRIDENNGMLLVEAGRMNDARLKLAEAGLSGEPSVGFELLDKEQGIGTSQFMETARYRRSLEGELARTIAGITNVRGARVHLAIPERSVFLRDQRAPSASVFIDVVSGRGLDEGEVRAIGNLVASSVPDMKLENVTIVDQKGKLLSNFEQDAEAVAASRQLEYTRKLEDQMVERVHRILEPVVGAGRYKAEVTADVDFTAIERTDETYNPDLPALRSEQRLDEQRGAGDAGSGIPGALSNQPPASGSAPEVANADPAAAGGAAGEGGAAAARNVRTQSTRNYELDRSLSYTRHQVGRLRRITVAVVLDDRAAAAGETRGVQWEAAELERITTLVRDAVGFDATRGDSVNVVNAPFLDAGLGDEVIPEIPIWQRAWFFPVLRQALGLLVALILGLALIRPVLRSLSSNVKQLRALEERHRLEREMAEEKKAAEHEDDKMLLPPPQNDYQRRLAAVNTLVDGDAEKVAQVIRKWVREGGGE